MTTTEIHTCGFSECRIQFQPNNRQISVKKRGMTTYCTPEHGTLARHEREKGKPRNPKPQPDTKPTIFPVVVPCFTPYGAHRNSVMSFPL